MLAKILIILLLVFLPQPLGKGEPQRRANTDLGTQNPPNKDECQQELRRLQKSYRDLETSVGEKMNLCERDRDKYKRERDQYKEERDRFKRERDAFEQNRNSCQDTLTTMRAANLELESTNRRLLKVSEDLQMRLEESGKSAAESSQQLDALRAEIRKEPSKLLAADDLTKMDASQNEAALRRFEEGGRVHEIRELMIGTLEVISVRNEITVPGALELKVIFKPHRVLTSSDGEGNVAWYIDLQFRPDKIQSFEYDAVRSNGQLKRKVGDKPAEEWIWRLKPAEGFKIDKPHIFGYASFERGSEAGGPVEIENREVEITEKYVPGFLAAVWEFIRSNLTFILGVFTAILAAATAYFGLKKQQLDVKLSELKLRLEEIAGKKSEGGEQTPGEATKTT